MVLWCNQTCFDFCCNWNKVFFKFPSTILYLSCCNFTVLYSPKTSIEVNAFPLWVTLMDMGCYTWYQSIRLPEQIKKKFRKIFFFLKYFWKKCFQKKTCYLKRVFMKNIIPNSHILIFIFRILHFESFLFRFSMAEDLNLPEGVTIPGDTWRLGPPLQAQRILLHP